MAPFQVHLVLLGGKGKDEEVRATAEQLYQDLQLAGIEVLYDDRDETPGVKFNDADLIGIPIRLTVSGRAQKAGGVEFKRRDQDERSIVPLVEVTAAVQETLAALQAAGAAMLGQVPFQ